MRLLAGRLLVVVALAHLLLSFAGIAPQLSELAPHGLIGAVAPPWQAQQPALQAIFWSSLGSFAGPQLLWGLSVVSAAHHKRRLPSGSGLALLILTSLQVTVAPVGGFWLNFLSAALLLASEFSTRTLKKSGELL